MGTLSALMSRSDVRGLLMRHTDAHLTNELVTGWLSGLAGYSVSECHAAMSAMGTAARRATPSEVTGFCDAARDRHAESDPPVPATIRAAGPVQRHGSPRRSGSDRDYHRQAGMRGIRAAYALMGWQRNADHDLARSVPCPFCKAKEGAVCGPLSRNRAGQREKRDHTTRMHPSRLDHARAELARQSAATPEPHEEPAR